MDKGWWAETYRNACNGTPSGTSHEETIPRPSFTREPEVERSNNFDGRVLGDYNQFGHVPILDFEYDEDGSTVP